MNRYRWKGFKRKTRVKTHVNQQRFSTWFVIDRWLCCSSQGWKFVLTWILTWTIIQEDGHNSQLFPRLSRKNLAKKCLGNAGGWFNYSQLSTETYKMLDKKDICMHGNTLLSLAPDFSWRVEIQVAIMYIYIYMCVCVIFYFSRVINVSASMTDYQWFDFIISDDSYFTLQ